MAQKVEITLIDDLTGRKATETVEFALDGKSYEIDLGEKNAQKLRDVLAEYVKAGRRTGRTGGKSKAKSGSTEDTAKIRAWAKDNGFDLAERGRVPSNIREAYYKAL
ncbi:histone-like nucleoid-structuring protein Lsr2 [Streptomyces tubercidicus]|uniref:histone-like nucleoid-structuring protein Lsr2 n=1 Tax=Streptomyces tubercidicus TaxID=47759 RepID=UPI00367DE86E